MEVERAGKTRSASYRRACAGVLRNLIKQSVEKDAGLKSGCYWRASCRRSPRPVTAGKDGAMVTIATETNPAFRFFKAAKILRLILVGKIHRKINQHAVCRILADGGGPGNVPPWVPLLALCHASDGDCRVAALRNTLVRLPRTVKPAESATGVSRAEHIGCR